MRAIVTFGVLALLMGVIVASPARAADRAAAFERAAPTTERVLPYPRSERAQAVWGARACWSDCGSFCAWGMAGCLERDPQGRCLKLANKCDRYCQRQCRTAGGPYVPDLLDF
jgi:hypothetical protein